MKKLIMILQLLLLTGVAAMAQDTWTIAGTSAICSGKTWDEKATENDMTPGSDGEWTLVKTNCLLEKDVPYECKVAKNHLWEESYPEQNYKFTVSSTGLYTVRFSFNSIYYDLSVDTEKTGEAEVGKKTWTIAGSDGLLFGTEWDPTDYNNDMEELSDGTYQLVISKAHLLPNTYKFKVCANHSWDESYGKDGGGSDMELVIDEEGDYTVTFTFNPETHVLSVEVVNLASGVVSVTMSAAAADRQAYMLTGSRARSASKGIVISNGQKHIVH